MTAPAARHSGDSAILPKVVILNDSSEAKGGATGLAILAARHLSARGHDTTFVAGDSGDDGAMDAHGIKLVALGGQLLLDRGKARAMRDGIYNKNMRDQITRHIAANDTPDTVYHLHGWSRILSPAVFDALRPVAARTFIHAHDYFLACPNGAYFDFGKRTVCTLTPLSAKCLMTTACDRRNYGHKLWRAARSRVLKRCFDVSLPWAGVLILHDKMQPALMRGGVPELLMQTLSNPASPFTPTRVPAEKGNSFCFIGRIETGKGIRTLCEAARLVKVPLRVIGDGTVRAELAIAYPEVDFVGWVDQADIGKHLGGMRAAVMPSQTPEPFGLVAAEATLSGLPIVLSQNALLADQVTDLKLGFVADPTSVVAMAKTLKEVATLPAAQVKDISNRGFSRSDSLCLTPEAWIDALQGHYLAAVGRDKTATVHA